MLEYIYVNKAGEIVERLHVSKEELCPADIALDHKDSVKGRTGDEVVVYLKVGGQDV